MQMTRWGARNAHTEWWCIAVGRCYFTFWDQEKFNGNKIKQITVLFIVDLLPFANKIQQANNILSFTPINNTKFKLALFNEIALILSKWTEYNIEHREYCKQVNIAHSSVLFTNYSNIIKGPSTSTRLECGDRTGQDSTIHSTSIQLVY